MIKFISKIIITVFCLAVFVIAIQYSMPYYWGNKGWRTKMNYIYSNDLNINTVFIGSSRTQMHIIPTIFDSITNHETNSFNLGYGSTSAEETLHFTENLIQGEFAKNKLKNIFVEVRPIWFNPENIFTSRSKYILDYSEYSFLKNYYAKTNYSYAAADFRKAYIEKILGIGIIKEMIEYHVFESHTKKNDFLLGKEKNGFINHKQAIQKDKLNKKLREASLNYQKTAKNLIARTNFARKSYNNLADIKGQDLTYIKRLQSLKEKAKSNGIMLYYYPTIRFENTNVPAIIHAIDSNQIFIHTANPDSFNLLYDINYSGDVSHLSNSGALEYTKIIAKIFINNNKIKSTYVY